MVENFRNWTTIARWSQST